MAVAAVGAPQNVVRRLTSVLFAAQSFASLGMIAVITVGSIAAAQVMGSTAYAGVPSTMYVLGSALGAYPAGRLMERYGRRAGLTLGFLVGVLGGVAGAFALIALVPALLFVAHALLGLARGALDQGRFAAGDLVTQEHRARSIGWVVLGGTVGGIGGPLFVGPAGRVAEMLGYDPLAGPYLIGILLFLFASVMVFALLRPDPRTIARQLARLSAPTTLVQDPVPPRSFWQALAAPNIQTAVAAMALGQVVMTTVMVMTPVHMIEHLGHTLDDVSIVIAAHVTGMYLTSVVTGRIADRVGHARTVVLGALLLILACVLAPFSTDTLRLAFALFVLGAGWNFCFVSGSTLLTDSLRPAERARVQGSNDLFVGLIAAAGSLGGGLMFERVGYPGIALAGITLAVTLLLIAVWTVRRRRVASGAAF